MTKKLIYIFFIFFILLYCCKRSQLRDDQDIPIRDLPEIIKNDTLKVLTLYSSISYFLYRGEEMGYEYELIKQFANSKNLKLEIIVAKNESSLVDMLKEGKGDIVVYNLPVTNEMRQEYIYCGQQTITHQVLIQRETKDSAMIHDVTELIGKDVYIDEGTKYEDRIKNLNDELGGGINIHSIDKDTLTTEDLIGMVATGDIPYTLADNNIAKQNKTYYNNLDISLKVSFSQRSSWLVNKDSPLLAEAVDDWFKASNNKITYRSIMKRYFEKSKQLPDIQILSPKKGQISHFDHLFKKYADDIDWDWRLIASQAYKESRFDTTAVSWAGAQGLMQLMPKTAQAFGLDPEEVYNPEANVKTAVKVIESLNKSFSKIKDPDERIKFILGSYNSGIGHVYDAMALAEKYGKNPLIWDKNVAEFLLLKSNPEYFNDEVCKFGYFRGRETYSYVKEVLKIYDNYKQKIPY